MNTPSTNLATRSLLFRLTQALEAFRVHRDDAPLHMPIVFLLIAQRNGIGAMEIARQTGLSQSSVSRNVRALGTGKADEPGLGLVAQVIDPKNPRARLIRLTSKGKELALELAGKVAVPVAGGPTDSPAEGQHPPGDHLHWEHWVD